MAPTSVDDVAEPLRRRVGRCGGCVRAIEAILEQLRRRCSTALPPERPAVGSPAMQGNPEVIELLNDVLTAELTAINQYFIHAKMMNNWGYERLAAHTRAESIDEMRHAEQVIERILFLEGVPEPAAPVAGAGRRDRARAVPGRRRARVRRHQAPERRHRRCASRSATTPPASCSRASSWARRSTPTGWRPSSGRCASSASTAYLAQQLHD